MLIPAIYLLLRRANQVLLLQRANTGYQDGTYSLVAGHMDGGELATQAMAREAREEAGVGVLPEALALVHVVHRLGSRCHPGQERLDLSWHPVDDLPENTLPLIRLVINDVGAGRSYSEHLEEPV